MKKKGLLKVPLFFLFCSLLYLPSQSQTRKYFIISGKIMADTASLKNCSIQIAKNNKKSVTSQIPEHGRFRLELEYGTDYQLVFNTDGYTSKTIVVHTGIPVELMNQPENFPHFLMAVRLFKMNEELTTQVQEISFSPEKKCFARVSGPFDMEYVEKGTLPGNPDIQSEINKTRMQGYQIF